MFFELPAATVCSNDFRSEIVVQLLFLLVGVWIIPAPRNRDCEITKNVANEQNLVEEYYHMICFSK
jgi:hypothetical protein